MGGMFIGTVFGVLIIPGLYYVFAKFADGRSLIKDEALTSVTDELMHLSENKNQSEVNATKINKLTKLLKKLTKKNNDEA